MQIEHEHTNDKGTFFINDGDKIIAEMVYSTRPGGEMIIEHTEVDNALKGKNIGTELVDRAVEYAKANNMKIVPVCRFANAIIRRNPAYKNLVR
jgi:predicted GNAT family acetyltransferase